MEITSKQELYQTSWSQNRDTDFIGFSFKGIHSSKLGIVRVSDGSRYNDNLLPTSQDKTAQVPGGDGTYYWDTFHTQKSFNVNIAFDGLSEENYRKMRQVFNTKILGKLIFDEAPYKYYMAKPTGIPQLKTICFEENGARVYKGEGTIQFTAYYPYAKSVYKWLDEYSIEEYPNKNEWAGASGMLDNASVAEGSNVVYDKVEGATAINLFNPGDMKTDFCLYFDFDDTNQINLTSISIPNFGLFFDSENPFAKQEEDDGIRINTKTNLIEGFVYKNIEKEEIELTGTLYNHYIKSGDFFKIPIINKDDDGITMQILGTTEKTATASKIEYEYIYY